MGKVTDELLGLIAKQLDDHGLVVWYDPERHYTDVAATLAMPQATVLHFKGSFFELRARLEPFLEFIDERGGWLGEERHARAVVYLPLERGATHHALVEAEMAGKVIEPGADHWQRNSRLKVIAERVLRKTNPGRAAGIAAEVEAGRWSLGDLDRLADQSGETGALQLLFDSTSPVDLVPLFLSSDERDEAITSKQSLVEFALVVENELGLRLDPRQPVGQFRGELARRLLLAELALCVEAADPNSTALAAIERPQNANEREELLAVCRTWRNRRDLRDAYVHSAEKVAAAAGLPTLSISAAALAGIETFAFVELALVQTAEEDVLSGNIGAARELAARRKASFWSLERPELQLRWTLIELACQLIVAARRLAGELGGAPAQPREMIDAYVRDHGDLEPWYMLDRRHRHLEHRWATFDVGLDGSHDALARVVQLARHEYHAAAARLATAFTEALAGARFEIADVLPQRKIFPRVRREMSAGKTAYLLVDALHYEMGCELVEGLGDGFESEIMPASAQWPTITEVGMAALMPGADDGLEIVAARGGKVAVRLGAATLKDRATRLAWFAEQVPEGTLALKLNDLMKPTRKRCEEIARADLVLVTSQEIDRLGEQADDADDARRQMDEMLDKLRRGIRRLAMLGMRRIVVAADHGHLFVDDSASDVQMDSPGGETVDLHPRVWIGRGGASGPGYLRATAAQLGVGGELEFAFPRGLACFRARGAGGGYLHGGLSLQELVVPLATIVVTAAPASSSGLGAVTMKLAKPRITTRFFSLEARYSVSGLFGEQTKRVKVSVRADRREVGEAAMAAYGFEEGTREITLEHDRTNAITVMLTADVPTATVSIHLIDATTLVELASEKNVPVEISI